MRKRGLERLLAHERNVTQQLARDTIDLTRDLAIAEDALEAERQWRLKSLPALLAAEERAVKAEAEVERLRHAYDDAKGFPELRQTRGNRAFLNAYHQSTNEERP